MSVQEQGAIPPAAHAQQVVRWSADGTHTVAQDQIADESPIAITLNGITHAVMMATPQNLEDFATGFCLSEYIIKDLGEIYSIETNVNEQGIELAIEIASHRFAELKQHRRSLAGPTGCGLCGVDSLAAVTQALPVVTHAVQVHPQAIFTAQAQLAQHQVLNQITGAMHAAAWVTLDGQIVFTREDVGRHNALDKLIGALARTKHVDRANGFVLMSSRASFELIQKLARANISLLASISAPTSMAIQAAHASGVGLVGFVRESGLVVYCGDGVV